MNYTLFEHQKEAVAFAENKPRFALLMAPRSGKTLTSLHILIEERSQKNIFIVCPTKVKQVWKSEVEKYFPQMQVTIINTSIESMRLRSIEGICIISPKLLKEMLGTVADNIICDEIHMSKGGVTFDILKKHCDRARNVVLLSATPADNRPRDLYSMFRLLKHPVAYLSGGEQYDKDEKKKYSFLYKFCFSGYVKISGGKRVQQYSGLKNKNELMEHIESCAFKYFPEEELKIIKQVVNVKITEVQRNNYDYLFDNYLLEQKLKGRKYIGNILTARQIVEMIKCREYISLIKAEHAKKEIEKCKDSHMIAFTSFNVSQKYLLSSFKNATDDMSVWRKEGGLFVSSPEKSGMGIEMVEARHIFMVDIALRVKNNSQALARIMGPNQTEKTIYNTFFMTDTDVDRRVLELAQEKMNQFDKMKV